MKSQKKVKASGVKKSAMPWEGKSFGKKEMKPSKVVKKVK